MNKNIDKALTKEDVIKDVELYGEILANAKKDFTISYQFMSQKYAMRRDRYRLYTKPDVYKDQILKIHYCMQQIQSFRSTYYENEMQAKRTARELWDDELWYHIQRMAEFDGEVMQKKRKDYKWLWDVAFYGVWIEIKTWYNKLTKTPEYVVASPESRLPDMYGNVIDNNREYHMFITKTTKYRLESANKSNPWTYFDLDKIASSSYYEYDTNEYNKKQVRLLSTFEDMQRNIRTAIYYKIIRWRKYLIELANYNSLIIRFEEIVPITDEEKENPSLVPFPVNVINMIPLDWDPCGLWLMELTLDKQWAMNRLMNLTLMTQQRNAGFTNYIYDLNVIQNGDLLTKKPLNWPNFIPWKTINGAPISNAIYPIVEQPTDMNSIGVFDKIQQLWWYETWFTDSVRGLSEQGETLGQAKQMQINANIMFSLVNQVLSRWLEWFRSNIWYRSLMEFMTSTEKKDVLITDGIWTQKIQLSKEDFVSGRNRRLRVESKKEFLEKNKWTLAYMQSQRPMMMQDPSVKQVSKNLFKRNMDELAWKSREAIYRDTPYTADEFRAIQAVNVINMWQIPPNLFKEWMDYMTYRLYIWSCDDSDIKTQVLRKIEQALIEEWAMQQSQEQSQQQSWQLQWLTNSMASQSNSNFLSQVNKKEVPSLQDVKK